MLPADAYILELIDDLEAAVRRLRVTVEDEQPSGAAQQAVHAKLRKVEIELIAGELAIPTGTVRQMIVRMDAARSEASPDAHLGPAVRPMETYGNGEER